MEANPVFTLRLWVRMFWLRWTPLCQPVVHGARPVQGMSQLQDTSPRCLRNLVFITPLLSLLWFHVSGRCKSDRAKDTRGHRPVTTLLSPGSPWEERCVRCCHRARGLQRDCSRGVTGKGDRSKSGLSAFPSKDTLQSSAPPLWKGSIVISSPQVAIWFPEEPYH